jgi:hypothetical protein
MNRVIVSGLALLTAVSLAACQQAPASDKAAELKAEQEKTAAMELRIAELEKKAEAAALAAPLSNLQAPAVAPVQAAPLPVERKQVRRTTTTSRTARRSTPASSSRVAVIPQAEARVEEPVVRTDRSRERDPWATTGDPGPRREEIPAGTALTLVLETPLSSASSSEGEAVTARIERAVSEDGRVVLPGGSVLRGRVSEVDGSGRVKGRAHLAVKWDTITVRGVTRSIRTSDVAMTADSNLGRDAKVIGGTTAAGAIIGGIVNGGRGAKKGAIIGAGAGTGAVLINKGSEVEMPSGSRWTVRVKETVRL